ncbi:MAG TPA: ADOP family duplicated permease [Vicinamibacterales bacterium]|nr:ADOP family duplicated permease [Vicinamibacterales bacterium]
MSRFHRLLLLAFPEEIRARVGRPLIQTLITDSHPAGRLALGRFIFGVGDVLRAGLAARFARMAATARRPSRGLRGWLDDLHHVRRSLTRKKAFVATVLVTLTLGIGITTTIAAVASTVFVRRLPYRDPARLAFMWTKLEWIGVPRAWVAGPHIDLLDREAVTIDSIVPLRTDTPAVIVAGRPDVVTAAFSTANLFDVLGVQPMAGRGFVIGDEPRNVAILSHAWWRRAFGSDPAVVGKFFELGPDRMEIIGVMPEDFRFAVHSSLGDPRAIDVWLPTRWPLATMSDGSFGFAALVRVKPEATLAQAQNELDIIGRRLDESRYKKRGFGWHLTGVQDDLTRTARAPVVLLAVASGLLLLVVAANMAGLMLTRHADRRREFTVRAAIGAPRGALVRLVLLESTVLWTLAGAAGLALAAGALRTVTATPWLPLPRLEELRIEPMIALGTMAASVMGGLLFGLVPALRATRDTSATALNEISRGNSARGGLARSILVTSEVALAVVLVAAGAVLLRSYQSLRAVDPGFSQEQVLLSYLPVDTARYPKESQAIDMFRRLIEGAEALPGVIAAGGTTSRPLSGDVDQTPAQPEGLAARPNADEGLMSDLFRITPGYLEAQGITVVEGRDFTWADRADAPQVALVDERFARQAWPGAAAIGRRVKLHTGPPVQVVGVVRHARQYRYEEDDRPQILRPYAQDTTAALTLAVRTTGDPEAIVGSLRGILAGIDPRQPLARITTMERVVSLTLRDRLLQLAMVAVFAISAILLAAIGVYSVLAALVADREREIGIRMALGASAKSVRGLVVGRMGRLTMAGLAIGTAVAFALSRLLDPLLFGVTARDPRSFAGTIALVLVAALVAAYVPVRRATAIDPTRALKRD